MAVFKPPKSEVTSKATSKEVSLKLFKAIVLEMNKRGKVIEQIKDFAKNPSPESLSLSTDPYSSRDIIFNQIKINTSFEDRVNILMELENTGQL